ncbi:MAG: acyl-CoA thioester hydrolase/BAAT C-terminal domain-containing protein [Acidobacteriota bacterium]
MTRRQLLAALAPRPSLREQWRLILGKLEPAPTDLRWFANPLTERILSTSDAGPYLRHHVELPLEIDFYQPGLLLVPKQPHPRRAAGICWSSTSPDWRKPEEWWGAWLASHGFTVFCSWSHIRHYRDNTNYSNGVSEKVYARFGRWAALSRMVWDVRQQARWLARRHHVHPRRIGFIGSSLSAKTALYVAPFAPEINAVVSIDPHVPLWDGGTNYLAPWYLDADRVFPDIPTPERTVRSLLHGHDHDELLTLSTPKPLLIIGGNDKSHSDGPSTLPLLQKAARPHLQFHLLNTGHTATHPEIEALWQPFFSRYLLAQ